jgi:predicted transcriptional regulator
VSFDVAELQCLGMRLLQIAKGEQKDARPGELDDQTLLRLAKTAYQARRNRDRILSQAFLSEPAWDMLLDSLVSRLEGRRTSVVSLCYASAAPMTTGLRYINILEREGLLQRKESVEDRRVVYIALTDRGFQLLRSFFVQSLHNSGSGSILLGI